MYTQRLAMAAAAAGDTPAQALFERQLQGKTFLCTQCGKCCTATPGEVWASDEEVQHIALSLGMDLATFIATYTQPSDSATSCVASTT